MFSAVKLSNLLISFLYGILDIPGLLEPPKLPFLLPPPSLSLPPLLFVLLSFIVISYLKCLPSFFLLLIISKIVAFSSFNSFTSVDVNSKNDLMFESNPKPTLPISPS